MVRHASLPLDGAGHRRRTVRTPGADTAMECVATVVVRDYSTWYWRTPAKVLDARPYGYHDFPYSVAGLDVETDGGAPPPAHRTRLVSRHARVEWALLHPRDASTSKSASGLSSICSTVSASRTVDVLDVVQRTSRHHRICLFSFSAFLAEKTHG